MGEAETDTPFFGSLDYVPTGVFVLGRDAIVLFWNRCMAEWSGVPSDQILGRRIGERFPKFDEPMVSDRLQDVFDHGQPVVFSSQLHHHLVPSPLPNGLFRTQHATVVPIPGPGGGTHYALFSLQDVTELTQRVHGYWGMYEQAREEVAQRKQATQALRKARDELEQRVRERTAELAEVNEQLRGEIEGHRRAEAALAHERDLLHALMDNVPDYVFFKDRQSRFVRTNRAHATMMGIADPQEAIGKTDLDLFPPEEAQRFYDEEQEIMQSGKSVIAKEWQIPTGLGAPIWVSESKIPLTDAEGQVVGLVAIARDITERKLLEEQLRETSKMEAVGTLAGGIAHEFNNMLMGILGLTEFLSEQVREPEPAADLAEIHKLAERGKSLTQQILAFSRKQRLVRDAVDLNKLVEDLCRILPRLIGEHVDVQFVRAPGLANVYADVNQMDQVLVNLAVNARDAMPQGGTLTIRTANATFDGQFATEGSGVGMADCVELSVSDTGSGMDEETLSHIFEPFYTTKEVGKGTGLGLATVYGIVKQHDGHIAVESKLGEGTTFRVYLPRMEGREPKPASEDESGGDLRGTETVLIVEDEPAVRYVAERALTRFGYQVICAANAQEADEVVSQQDVAVDILLADVVMPGESGHQLFERMSARNPSLRALFMSGYDERARMVRDLKASGLPFIQKPVKIKELAERVREVLDS